MANERRSNRRGRRSREEILDVATRVMAERGYAATTMSTLSRESRLPASAFYHHFRSKGGLLSAVMARGAYDFFAAMRAAHAGGPGPGTPLERLDWYLQRSGDVFLAQPDFLRLHLLLMMSSEAQEAEVGALIMQVRRDGRAYMNQMIADAFEPEGADAARQVADQLDYFAIAGFDGAFVAIQAEPDLSLNSQLRLLSLALASLGAAILDQSRTR